jgi:serine phosphatase RsbU (regulator of sigma subunit)
VSDPVPVPASAAGFTCGEVRGGNGVIYERLALPGLRGVLYSRPCSGASGGDIHYVSVCGSGLLARVCLADVAGHGPTIAAVGVEMHAHLRRSVDVIDERRVLSRMDRRLDAKGLRAMTTAVLATYYPPSRRLTVSYAGHPTGWLYRAHDRAWTPLRLPSPALPRPSFVNLPLGTRLSPTFTRHRFRVSPGDRMVLVTDGVIETTSPDDVPFGAEGISALLAGDGGSLEALAAGILSALHAHAATDELAHDDVTFLVAEFEAGPPGPAIWHVVRNRLLARFVPRA